MTDAVRLTSPGRSDIMYDDAGRLLLNTTDLAKAGAGGNYTRYNGGWLKTITAIDKRKTNGYSLVGEFLDGRTSMYLRPGVYLDCSVGGSRKHHYAVYTVFRLSPTGEVEKLGDENSDHRDWAVRLWPVLEAAGVPEYHPAPKEVAKAHLEGEELEALARKLVALDDETWSRLVTRYNELKFDIDAGE